MSVEITNTPDEGVGVHRLEDILDVPERESLEEPIEDRYDRAGTTKLDAHTLAAENIDKELLHGDRDDPLHGEWLRLKLIECERLYCDLGPSEDGKFTIAQKRVRVYIVDSESAPVDPSQWRKLLVAGVLSAVDNDIFVASTQISRTPVLDIPDSNIEYVVALLSHLS